MRIKNLVELFTRILLLGGVFIPTFYTFAQHKIIYSTYLGGNDVSQVNGIEVDETGNIFVVGETRSKTLPITEKALEKDLIRSASTFLQVIDSEGKLIYSTYLNNTRMVIHKIDYEGFVYLTGFVGDIDKIQQLNEATVEPFYSTPNAFQTKTGNRFVMKLDIKQGKVIYSPYAQTMFNLKFAE